LIHVHEDVCETSGEEEAADNRTSGDEGEEVAVVSTSDAVIEPDAVVILSLDAVVADSTVVTSRWPPDIAGLAVLSGDFHSSSGRLSGLYHRPIVHGWSESKRIFGLIWRWHLMEVSWKNSRIRNGSMDERRHAYIKHIGKYNGYRWRNVVP
jgi:hypothetical protein